MTWKDNLKKIREGAEGLLNDAGDDLDSRVGKAHDAIDAAATVAGATLRTGAAVGKLLGRQAMKGVRSGVDALQAWYDQKRDYLENTLAAMETYVTTDGEYDAAKAKEFLKDRVEATKVIGPRAYDALVEVLRDVPGALKKDWKGTFKPSELDMKTKYAGIGTNYNGTLFTRNYEDCIEFMGDVKSLLPNGMSREIRQGIILDIKENAFANVDQLVDLYDKQDDILAQNKLAALDKYVIE